MPSIAGSNFSPDVERLIALVDATKASQFYWTFNSSLYKPYHNHVHVNCMLSDLVHMLRFVQHTDPARARKVCSQIHLKILVEAILFHDFNHSGGELIDSLNIEKAIAGYLNYLDFVAPRAASHVADPVKFLILSTQYPYLVSEVEIYRARFSTEFFDLHGVIRDLDLMSMYHIDEYGVGKAQYLGLWREFQVTKPGMSLDEFIKGNTQFMKAATWHTEYGKHLSVSTLPACLESFKTFWLQ